MSIKHQNETVINIEITASKEHLGTTCENSYRKEICKKFTRVALGMN